MNGTEDGASDVASGNISAIHLDTTSMQSPKASTSAIVSLSEDLDPYIPGLRRGWIKRFKYL